MAKSKRRDCTSCIGYSNMIEGYKCGLGFEVVEDIEGGYGGWEVTVHPYEDACEKVDIPKTKKEFVKTAELLGIEWDINDVLSIEEFESCF